MRFPAAAIALWFGLSGAAAIAEEAKGLVTFTFDDATQAQFDLGLTLAREHGIVGTLFVPTGLIGDAEVADSWTMSWAEVRQFAEAGWEIGAHGSGHIRLTELDPALLPAEIEAPARVIADRIGIAPVSFSSPFGAFNEVTLDRIMQTYRAHLSWQGHGGRNPRDSIDPMFIGRLEVVNSMTALEVCGEMVASARDGTWLVLLFHGITEGPPGEYEVSATMMGEIFSCAAFLQARGLIEIKTVRDALGETEATP